ncbi:UDP-glucose dehydrogenase family protein [Alkanindiges illinoisensis]|uniref:UDP-glucose dehydrogenase family protein n=1 Tax=Alkanindiges illinoisensis TaxID=197183 RepID=UPI00047C34B4|nr:nucleotide sugar dehydrogenase [Alkanindiges illinoisensis]
MKIHVYGDNLCALVSAALFASVGHDIWLCLPEGRVKQTLEAGEEAYPEPRLQGLLDQQRKEQRLVYTNLNEPMPDDLEAVFLAFAPKDFGLAEQIVKKLGQNDQHLLVINQSTFAVGCSARLASHLSSQQSLVYVPDFIQEGVAIDSIARPNKIILGMDDPRAENQIREIFRPFNRLKDHFLKMSLREAEFTKLAVSGMLATRISFMNDLSNVADAIGVDIEQIRVGMGSDKRIGEAYLYPGCGFGGQSFSEDVINLAQTVSGVGIKSKLLHQVLQINEDQKEVLFRKLWRYFDCDLSNKTVGIWGAAYKPNTNKIDNAPILKILEALWAQGAVVKLHDPVALEKIAQLYGQHEQLILCESQYDAATNVDALMLVTEWKQYWNPNFRRLKQSMNHPLILDGRNIYNPYYLKDLGFEYVGIGRGI